MNQNAIVLMFGMPSCELCVEMIPRFERIAREYKAQVRIQIFDASVNHDGLDAVMDQFKVEAVPALVVAKRSGGYQKLEGTLSDNEIRHALNRAVALNR